MPVNDRYPLREVIEACRAFYERKRRRVFVEYVMLAGVNDRYEQALALARALRAQRAGERSIFKVNLIPYNPTDSPFAAPPARRSPPSATRCWQTPSPRRSASRAGATSTRPAGSWRRRPASWRGPRPP